MATAQVIAFDESIKFLNKLGIENIMKHEKNFKLWTRSSKKNNSVRLVVTQK